MIFENEATRVENLRTDRRDTLGGTHEQLMRFPNEKRKKKKMVT